MTGGARLGVSVGQTFEQVPSLLGRQLVHCLLAFAQAQRLHEPVLLHLQHCAMAPQYRLRTFCVVRTLTT